MNPATTFIFAFVIALVRGTDDYFDSSEVDARSSEAETITKRNSKLDESEITLIERTGENMKADTILSGMETLKESPLVLRTSDLSRESITAKTDEFLLEGRSNEPALELSKSVQDDDKSRATEVSPEGRSDTKDGDSERVGNNFEDDKTTTKVKIEGRNSEEQEKTDSIESKSSDELNSGGLQNRRMMIDTEDLATESRASSHTKIEGKSSQTPEDTFLSITPNFFGRIKNCCGMNLMHSFNPSLLPIPKITNPFLTSNIMPKSINPVTNGYNPQLQNLFYPRNKLRPIQEMNMFKREMINAYNEYPLGTTTTLSPERFPFKEVIMKQGFPTEQRKLFEQNSEKYFNSFQRLPSYRPPQAPFLYPFLPVV